MFVLTIVFWLALIVAIGALISAALSQSNRRVSFRIAAVGFVVSGFLGIFSIGIPLLGAAVVCMYASLYVRGPKTD